MYSIENIDVKKSLNWLSNLDKTHEIKKYTSFENKIIICDNFLSVSECDEIIKNGEKYIKENLDKIRRMLLHNAKKYTSINYMVKNWIMR